MAFEDLIARINLFLSDVENEPKDAHELLEQLHLELNQLRATGQPVPEDLLRLERQLDEEFRAEADDDGDGDAEPPASTA